MASATSNDSWAIKLPPPPHVLHELVGNARLLTPPDQIPEPGSKEVERDRSTRVEIWRVEVNRLEPSCSCSLATYQSPTMYWCPNCGAQLEGISYDQFPDGQGLTRLPTGRRSIANVWPVVKPSEKTNVHRNRLVRRSRVRLFHPNEFTDGFDKGISWLLAKTRLQGVIDRRKMKRQPYMPPEYGDMPGSVTEMEPKYAPVDDNPAAQHGNPVLELCAQRKPAAKLGDSVPKTEMYRSLRGNPIADLKDHPSVSSLLDAWSSSSGDGDRRNGKKPKLTLDASAERLGRAQLLLSKKYGDSAMSPPNAQAIPAQGTTNIRGN
ncbi:uncharacterized protein PG998_001237 [Apiospora kogelbergensis]|uniref:Uncharacterized protein n=1 Tax=Apiospora kogelbergensis TaxID=1337665 RepID=A0AAW0QTU1_9PEZI